MTRQQFEEKFAQLIRDFDFPAYAVQLKNKALKSGGVDFEKWDNDMILPKALLFAIFQECASQVKPFSKEGIRQADRFFAVI